MSSNLCFVTRRRQGKGTVDYHNTVKDLLGNPHLDIRHHCKLLQLHCEIKFPFQRSTASLSMRQAGNAYRFNIKKAELTLRQVHVREEEVEVPNKAVMNSPLDSFDYPILRGKVVKYMLTQGYNIQPSCHHLDPNSCCHLLREGNSQFLKIKQRSVTISSPTIWESLNCSSIAKSCPSCLEFS